MLPTSYQRVLRTHLSESQYLTLQLLVLMLQSYRQVQLSQLANIFPQPIQYSSRVRNLQRFLALPQLSVQLLWFPILKHWLKQEFRGKGQNRAERRKRMRVRQKYGGHLLVIVDRTQWKTRNIMMVCLAWGGHGFPVYWQCLPKRGSSSFAQQKRLLTPVLRLLKPYPLVVTGDREFHSPRLAAWLAQRQVDVLLRQKKSTCIQLESDADYRAIPTLGFQPGDVKFFRRVHFNKEEAFGPFNLAVRWKRKYRGKSSKDPWYILTTLHDCTQVLSLYRKRWGIEMMFRDCKSGGYNLESTRTNEIRLLALILIVAIAYTLATRRGLTLDEKPLNDYIARRDKTSNGARRYSQFWLGLHGRDWCNAMDTWTDLMLQLVALKPHKRRYFQRGIAALSMIQQEL
jgi:Transposase DDE domain